MAKPAKKASTSKTYVWTGIDATGKRVKRQKVVAPSEGAAVAALRAEGYLPTSLELASSGGLNMEIGPTGVKYSFAQRAEFARRLHQMLRAGISVPKALMSMAEDAKPAVAKMMTEMAEVVASGKPLSTALKDHPRAFDDVFIAYVSSGEEAGTLAETMARLSTLLAKRAAMQARIKAVMAYPKMVGGTVIVIVFGIIAFLVPSFAKIYAQFGATLPKPTLALVWLSDHMLPLSVKMISDPFPFILPVPKPFNIMSVVAYLVIGWVLFRRRTRGDLQVGRKLDRIKFKAPVMGSLWHKSSLFQWASTLSGALAAGVPLTRALDLSSAASGSDWQKLAGYKFAEAVRTGRPISAAMAEEPDLYPPSVRTMVATGEQTGEVDQMLESVAMSLDEEVESLVGGLSAKMEVALLLVMGVVVGGLLIVLYLPILGLATTASKGMGMGN